MNFAKIYADLKKLSFDVLQQNALIHNLRIAAYNLSNKFQKLELHFNGDIISWRNFRSMIRTNTEKFLYLKQAVHGGPAAEVIEC